MSTYNIPRDVKGEGRILTIFTSKSLIYTCIGGGIGLLFYYIFGTIFKIKWLGIAIAAILAGFGFLIATFKIPENSTINVLNKIGGEYIDKAFLRWLKFKRKKNVIYTYLEKKEENK